VLHQPSLRVEAVATGIDRGGNVLAIDFESGWADDISLHGSSEALAEVRSKSEAYPLTSKYIMSMRKVAAIRRT
jgi:hypothetical protein